MSDYEIETSRRVFDNNLGTSIRVGPDADGLGLLVIDGGEDYGGSITIPPDMAHILANAIIAAANDMPANK